MTSKSSRSFLSGISGYLESQEWNVEYSQNINNGNTVHLYRQTDHFGTLSESVGANTSRICKLENKLQLLLTMLSPPVAHQDLRAHAVVHKSAERGKLSAGYLSLALALSLSLSETHFTETQQK